MASLPAGWESDYDGNRWFFRYKPTGIVQFTFPKPGDEFPEFVDASAPPIDLPPEERLVSQQQVKRRSTADGQPIQSAPTKPKDEVVSATLAKGEGGGFWFQPDYMYLGPGSYDISPLQEFDEEEDLKLHGAASRVAQPDGSPAVSADGTPLTGNVKLATGTPESGSAVLVSGDPSSAPAPIRRSSPLGVVAELGSESTAKCRDETHPAPVELPGHGMVAEAASTMVYANGFDLAPAELPASGVPAVRRESARGEEQKVLSPGAPGTLSQRYSYAERMGRVELDQSPRPPANPSPQRDDPLIPPPAAPAQSSTPRYQPYNPARASYYQGAMTYGQDPNAGGQRPTVIPAGPVMTQQMDIPPVLRPPQPPPKRPLDEPDGQQQAAASVWMSQQTGPGYGPQNPGQPAFGSRIPSVLQPARGRPSPPLGRPSPPLEPSQRNQPDSSRRSYQPYVPYRKPQNETGENMPSQSRIPEQPPSAVLQHSVSQKERPSPHAAVRTNTLPTHMPSLPFMGVSIQSPSSEQAVAAVSPPPPSSDNLASGYARTGGADLSAYTSLSNPAVPSELGPGLPSSTHKPSENSTETALELPASPKAPRRSQAPSASVSNGRDHAILDEKNRDNNPVRSSVAYAHEVDAASKAFRVLTPPHEAGPVRPPPPEHRPSTAFSVMSDALTRMSEPFKSQRHRLRMLTHRVSYLPKAPARGLALRMLSVLADYQHSLKAVRGLRQVRRQTMFPVLLGLLHRLASHHLFKAVNPHMWSGRKGKRQTRSLFHLPGSAGFPRASLRRIRIIIRALKLTEQVLPTKWLASRIELIVRSPSQRSWYHNLSVPRRNAHRPQIPTEHSPPNQAKSSNQWPSSYSQGGVPYQQYVNQPLRPVGSVNSNPTEQPAKMPVASQGARPATMQQHPSLTQQPIMWMIPQSGMQLPPGVQPYQQGVSPGQGMPQQLPLRPVMVPVQQQPKPSTTGSQAGSPIAGSQIASPVKEKGGWLGGLLKTGPKKSDNTSQIPSVPDNLAQREPTIPQVFAMQAPGTASFPSNTPQPASRPHGNPSQPVYYASMAAFPGNPLQPQQPNPGMARPGQHAVYAPQQGMMQQGWGVQARPNQTPQAGPSQQIPGQFAAVQMQGRPPFQQAAQQPPQQGQQGQQGSQAHAASAIGDGGRRESASQAPNGYVKPASQTVNLMQDGQQGARSSWGQPPNPGKAQQGQMRMQQDVQQQPVQQQIQQQTSQSGQTRPDVGQPQVSQSGPSSQSWAASEQINLLIQGQDPPTMVPSQPDSEAHRQSSQGQAMKPQPQLPQPKQAASQAPVQTRHVLPPPQPQVQPAPSQPASPPESTSATSRSTGENTSDTASGVSVVSVPAANSGTSKTATTSGWGSSAGYDGSGWGDDDDDFA
ncbi:hypothetical protein QBC47DRAFT_356143 [Echria macrotheca]|uniref:WW domain-containing protein n=1 Tax=Echria macrotheca TaxID=438768 RepID=A0AAJ0BQ98_9PEZI|nr:hypothetical protein QBC47DRAFT_356143 [Echria macrotheca]